MTHRTIDLNADLGEGFPNDAALLDRVTSASIACMEHAGDRATVLTVLGDAKQRGVTIGAHPGFADRENFGRREQSPSAAEVAGLINRQVEVLSNLADLVGTTIRYVKPHGALYNQAQREEEIAAGVVAALSALGLPLLGQPGSVLEARALRAGVVYIAEGFPDRRYRADGRLVPRSEPDAVLHDPAEIEAQVVRLVDRGVSTLCIHGDDPRAVAIADTVRAILRRRQIALKSFA
jgi:UPF0271 protein